MPLKWTKTLELTNGGEIIIESGPNGAKVLSVTDTKGVLNKVLLTPAEHKLLRSEL